MSSEGSFVIGGVGSSPCFSDGLSLKEVDGTTSGKFFSDVG